MASAGVTNTSVSRLFNDDNTPPVTAPFTAGAHHRADNANMDSSNEPDDDSKSGPSPPGDGGAMHRSTSRLVAVASTAIEMLLMGLMIS